MRIISINPPENTPDSSSGRRASQPKFGRGDYIKGRMSVPVSYVYHLPNASHEDQQKIEEYLLAVINNALEAVEQQYGGQFDIELK